MGKIDIHSLTWQAVEAWLTERRADCVQSLINGTEFDQRLRGEIRVMDDLIEHAHEAHTTGESDEPTE
ncbi:hypothetical protein ACU6TU_08385 [Halomonas sp. LS-001]